LEQSDEPTEAIPTPEHELALRIVGRQMQLELLIQIVAEHLVDLFPGCVEQIAPAYARRTISTFSCDIAYSDNPTASRAAAVSTSKGPKRLRPSPSP
jgi:hypothetical protein